MMRAVALPNSPIFSPSRIRSSFCKPSGNCSTSPRIQGPPSVTTPQSPSAPLALSPPSPLSLRIQKHMDDVCGSVLKRKRPPRLDIPFGGSIGFGLKMTPRGDEGLDDMEVLRDGYSVYCKRGRRGCAIEDRYSAFVGLNGDHKQVC